MTYITELHLRGFKSFNKKSVLKFGPGFNCVIGANGSGKSNILDSLCFVLGRLSTKSLRADNYSDLVFKRKTVTSKDAEVGFTLDNSAKIFPADVKDVSIMRKIRPNGSTQYKLNGKNVTRQQTLEFLSHSKITPDGHNIILQGDINRFVDMSPIEKRLLIEEVAGIRVYEEKKVRSLRELDKVEERLKEANIVLTEKETYLTGLEAEKKEAERYRSVKNELLASQATEVRLKIASANNRKNRILNDMKKVESDLNKIAEELESKTKKKTSLKKKISTLEEEIEKKGGEEQLALQKSLETMKVELESQKNLITSSENEIQRVRNRRYQLDKNLKELSAKIAEKTGEKSQFEKTKKELERKIDSSRKKAGLDGKSLEELQEVLEKAERSVEEFKQEKDNGTKRLQQITSEQQIIEYKLQDLESKISDIESQSEKLSKVKGDKGKYKDILKEIGLLANKDSKLAFKLGELRRELISKEEELARQRIRAGSNQELLLRDRAIKVVLDMKRSKGAKGILGTVASLGKVDPNYSTALQVAAGGRMKNIVVDSPEVAIACLKALKESKSGTATFLPLSKIRIPILTESVKLLAKRPGAHGFAHSLITSDTKYSGLFRYVFGHTLIVDDVEVAKSFGVGNARMVTLDGDVFESSGAITGGYRSKNVGVGFDQIDSKVNLDSLANSMGAVRKEVKTLENERLDLEKNLMALRQEKAELEGRIESVKDFASSIDLDQIELKHKEFKSELKDFKEEERAIDKRLIAIDDSIGKKTVECNSIKVKMKELQFGDKKKEIDILDTKVRDLDSKIAVLDAALENALQPERDNIVKVIKELEKECIKFDVQIKESEKKIKSLKKNVAAKEAEEKSFYGKLKELFNKKHKLGDEFVILEKAISDFGARKEIREHEKNNHAIQKAKVEAEFAALKEELEPLKDVKALPHVEKMDEARRLIQDLGAKLNEMGNVNMRALEIYETVKKEFDDLSWRVGKLASERADILDVIKEIEGRKLNVFMETYDKVDKNFTELFGKMTDKGTAQLYLEKPNEPFEGGLRVSIVDSKGKRMSLPSLSGGEKVLVALAFIFSIQEFNPASFYLLDEIDAALDKVNSEKIAKLLREYSKKAQVIIVSHNDAVVTEADQVVGVSMNKNGESSLVSIKL